MNKKILSLLAGLLVAPVSAAAFEVIQGEILAGWVLPDGNRVAAIRLTLEPGWKTYWRAPGDLGIPPDFNWTKSENLADVAIEWPAPTVFREKNLTTIGYKNQVILPLRIDVVEKDVPVTVAASVSLGVCSDICVPASLDLNAVIDTDTTRPDPEIAAALAQRPYSAQEAQVDKATCNLGLKDGSFELVAAITLPDTGGQGFVVIEPGQSDLWGSETDTSRDGGVLRARADIAHVKDETVALDRSQIRITVLGSNQAVDIRGCTSD